MWKDLKDARRTYERAAARNLLTDHDEVQVGRLLRGETELQYLNPETENVQGITEVYQAKQEYERISRLLRQWNQSRKAALRQQAEQLLETANDWKDKKSGILYARETMERNIRGHRVGRAAGRPDHRHLLYPGSPGGGRRQPP